MSGIAQRMRGALNALTRVADPGLAVAGGAPRNPRWSRESRLWLVGKRCAASGSSENLAVHHKKPFHLFPAEEMDPDNWICLSNDGWGGINYHILIGHGGSYEDYNAAVIDDAARCLAMIQGRVIG